MSINYKNHPRHCNNKAEFILSNFVIVFLNLWFSNEAVFNIFFFYRSLFCRISHRGHSYFKFHKIKS